MRKNVSTPFALLVCVTEQSSSHKRTGDKMNKESILKGVHGGKYGISKAATYLANALEAACKESWAKQMELAKQEHETKLEELKSMPSPELK